MRVLLAIATALAGMGCAAHAGDAAASTLVGRNGQFTVTEKTGKSETVDTKQLNLKKEILPSGPRAIITDTEGATASGEKKLTAPGAKTAPAPNGQSPAPKDETPEEKAIRAADVEALRAMRKQGGAYFYTEDNKPVSFEEIDRRIASGEVEGLKAIGLHLEDWKPKTKAKSNADTTEAPPSPTPEPTAPKQKY